MIASFFFWEHHVINGTSRPPLIRLKLFTRAKGRLAAVYAIGFISWMGFNVNFLCDNIRDIFERRAHVSRLFCIMRLFFTNKSKIPALLALCSASYRARSQASSATYSSPKL